MNTKRNNSKQKQIAIKFSNPASHAGYVAQPLPPDQASLIRALARYPNLGLALAEFIDNSGEYRASTKGTIKVYIDQKAGRIVIADDGTGVNESEMRQMFRINRQSHKAGETGVFGYGFKSASHHLGRDIHVVSLKENQFTYGRMHDAQEWDYPVETCVKNSENYKECVKMWNEWGIGPMRNHTGTIIILEDLIEKKITNTDIVALKRQLGMTYFDVFSQKKSIDLYLNDEKVKYTNPLGALFSHGKKMGSKLSFGWFKKSLIYIDETGMKHKLVLTTSLLPDGAGTEYAGFCVLRCGRLVAKGCKWGYTYIMGAQASMRRFQIMLECGADLDDLLSLSANKIIDKDQKINSHFFAWLNCPKTGLRPIVEQQYGTSAKPAKQDLSGWQPVLNHLSKLAKKNEKLVSQLKVVSAQGTPTNTQKKPRAKSTKTGSHTGATKVSKGLDKYKGVANLSLRPLGENGPEYEIDSKMIGTKEQTILVFNEDIRFIKEMIDITRQLAPTAAAKAYVAAKWSEAMVLKAIGLTPQEETMMNKINRKLYSKRKEYGAGKLGTGFNPRKQAV